MGCTNAKADRRGKKLIVTHLAQFWGYADISWFATDQADVEFDRFQVKSHGPTGGAGTVGRNRLTDGCALNFPKVN